MTANTKPEVLQNQLVDLDETLNEAIRLLPSKLLLQQILAKKTKLQELNKRLQFDPATDVQQQINILFTIEKEISEESAAIENLFLLAKMEKVSEKSASLIRLIRSRFRPDNFPPFQSAWLGHLEQWVEEIRKIHSPARIRFLESEIIPKLESLQKELEQWEAQLKIRLEQSEQLPGEASRKKKKRFDKQKEKVKWELQQGYLSAAEKLLEKLERKREFSRVEAAYNPAELQTDPFPEEQLEYRPMEIPSDWVIAGELNNENAEPEFPTPILPPPLPEAPESFSALEMEEQGDVDLAVSGFAGRLGRWLKERIRNGSTDFSEWLKTYHQYFQFVRQAVTENLTLAPDELQSISELEWELQNRFAENYLKRIEEMAKTDPRPEFLLPDPLRAYTPYFPVIIFHFNSIRLDQWWVLREQIVALLPRHYAMQRFAFKLKKPLPEPIISREIPGCYNLQNPEHGELFLDGAFPAATDFRVLSLPEWEENAVLPDLIREDLPGMTIVKCSDWREERACGGTLWEEISANLQENFERLSSWRGLRRILARLSQRNVRIVFTAGDGNIVSTRCWEAPAGLRESSPRSIEFLSEVPRLPNVTAEPVYVYSDKVFLKAPFRLAAGTPTTKQPEPAGGGISLTECILPFEIFEPISLEKGL